MTAVIAFRGFVALVPTIFLLVGGVVGAVLRGDRMLQTAILATVWVLPASGARDGLDAISPPAAKARGSAFQARSAVPGSGRRS